jgi:Fe-S cluster assembly protein SufD
MSTTGTGLTAAFEKHASSLTGAPTWWRELKAKAFATYASLPMPTRKNETWRFASITGLSLEGYDFSASAGAEAHAALANQARLVDNRAGRLIFADNQLVVHERASDELAAQGVIWSPLAEAITKHGDILQEYFMAQDPQLGSEKFAALHTAFVTSGSLLYVPKNVEITLPFVARHWAAADGGAVLPHTLVITGENAKVTMIDVFDSSDRATRTLALGFNHLFAGRGSRIDYYVLQNWSEQTLGFQINSVTADRDATINALAVNMGCNHYRSETQSIMKGEGSHTEMLSLSIADREQEIDQRTLQIHQAGHATSNLLFKNALADQARTIFSGLIRVAPDAQKTDAYQTNRNLLLSGEAEAHSLPGLEIEANDVKCSHGATTSQIDDSELFYMLARGINKRMARELFVFGFFDEVVSKIENEQLAGRIRELILQKFRDEEARRG